MIVEYKNTKVNYITFGKGKTILYLHGWGGSTQSFLGLANHMKGYKNILVDFPPFGKSEEPKTPFDIFDYANIIGKILSQERVKEFSIVSHSFGTRVAICLCNRYNVNKLIITGGAGLKPKNKIKKIIRKIKYKIIKIFNKNAQVGSKDYKNLSIIMKKTFNNIINLNLDYLTKNIKAQTLIIYGDEDNETPIYMAKKFNKLINNSKLIIYKNCNHFAYLQNFNQFLIDTKNFIKD